MPSQPVTRERHARARPLVVDVVGAAGVGKSTICRLVAAQLAARLGPQSVAYVTAGPGGRRVPFALRLAMLARHPGLVRTAVALGGVYGRHGPRPKRWAKALSAVAMRQALVTGRYTNGDGAAAGSDGIGRAPTARASTDHAGAGGNGAGPLVVIVEQGLAHNLMRRGTRGQIGAVPGRLLPDVIVHLESDRATLWRRRILRDKPSDPQAVADRGERIAMARKVARSLASSGDRDEVVRLLQRWGTARLTPALTDDEITEALEPLTIKVRPPKATRWSKALPRFQRRGCTVLTFTSNDEVAADVLAAEVTASLRAALERPGSAAGPRVGAHGPARGRVRGRGRGRARDLRPTVFVPIDIKVREFRPKLLVAAEAAARGFRVYLGTKSAVDEAVRADPERAGVFFAKGAEHVAVLADAARRCERVVMLDEELGPALSRPEVEHYWHVRYSPAIVELLDRMLLFSSSHLAVLEEIWPRLAAKASVTGWPRVDLWRQGREGPDGVEADRIGERHGAFALFVSNFKINSAEQVGRRVDIARTEAERLDPESRARLMEDPDLGTKASHRLASFERAVQLLHALDDRPGCPPIVVRPHPSEDPDIWRQALAGCANISVIYEGEAGPWLLAARAVLHTGCTTAVQAFHYGVPAGHMTEVGFMADTTRDAVPYRVSTPLDDTGATVAFLRAVFDGTAPTGPATADAPGEHELGSLDGRAAARIATELAGLDVTARPRVRLPRWRVVASWLVAGYRRVKRSRPVQRVRGRRYYGSVAQPKIPGGIHVREARQVIAGLPIDGGIRVTEPRSDLLCIEPEKVGDSIGGGP